MSIKRGTLERQLRKLLRAEEMYEIVRYFGKSVPDQDRKNFKSRIYKSAFEIVDFVEGKGSQA